MLRPLLLSAMVQRALLFLEAVVQCVLLFLEAVVQRVRLCTTSTLGSTKQSLWRDFPCRCGCWLSSALIEFFISLPSLSILWTWPNGTNGTTGGGGESGTNNCEGEENGTNERGRRTERTWGGGEENGTANWPTDLGIYFQTSAITLYDVDTVSTVHIEIWKENILFTLSMFSNFFFICCHFHPPPLDDFLHPNKTNKNGR